MELGFGGLTPLGVGVVVAFARVVNGGVGCLLGGDADDASGEYPGAGLVAVVEQVFHGGPDSVVVVRVADDGGVAEDGGLGSAVAFHRPDHSVDYFVAGVVSGGAVALDGLAEPAAYPGVPAAEVEVE